MIPDIIELNFPKIDGKQYATLTHATANIADMGEKTISTQVKIDGEITPDFSFDWEVAFQGEKYIMPLRIPQGAKGDESLKSQVDLSFQHWAIYQLKRWPFVTIQQIAAGTYLPDEEVATVSLNLGDLCKLFGQVLEYYYGGAITIDLNPAWEYKHEATIITISHTKIWNVLIDAFHDKYGVRWEIKPASDNSNTVKGGERYVIRVGYPTTEVDHIFEYGFEGGLLKVERQVQSEEIRNMLKGRGGETNIPFRYFKNTDPNNKDFRPDPDWVEELANIPFTNLMPATFRSYVQGWKAAHISKYPGYTAVGESNAYAPWAYRKGYTDTKFAPVEFVADEIVTTAEVGDRYVEILPGYSPCVKEGSSLDKYGPLPDTLDNNEEIYPTLQGTGLDIAVDVEQIQSDSVGEDAAPDVTIKTIEGATVEAKLEKGQRKTLFTQKSSFTIPTGRTGNLIADAGTPLTNADKVEVEDYTIRVYSADGAERSASGIPPGTYQYDIKLSVHNMDGKKSVTAKFGVESARIQDAVLANAKGGTFDIWVKNIWNTQKSVAEDGSTISGETDSQYSERVWKPILGDREGNTAKVVFTSGELAASEDYEFIIVGFPVPDTSKTWQEKNDSGEIIATHQSHWRIRLAKSDAEMEATGLYVPSTRKQGKAGDRFVFIGTEMTHVPYVVDAEIRLDDWKKDQLREKKEVNPTFVVTPDRVRINGYGEANALINQLRVGNSVTLQDKRFIDGSQQVNLYLQSITYTFREPTPEDAALNPDVELVLSNDYAVSANPVSIMQGEISAIQRQIGALSNIEQAVRAVGDKKYMRKDRSDRTPYALGVGGLLTAENGIQDPGYVSGTNGAAWGIDKAGNMGVESIDVRSFMRVMELITNRQRIEDADSMLTEGDTIESVEELEPAGNGLRRFRLRLRAEWEGYRTAQVVNNVLRAIYNDITDSLTGTGTQTLHGVAYATSWMLVTSADPVNNTLEVTLYADADCPAGANFAPVPLMKIARWGNAGTSEADRSRQRLIYFSSTEGRIVMRDHVTKPKTDERNMEVCLGTVPEFLVNANVGVGAGDYGLYVKTLIAERIVKRPHGGLPEPVPRYRGPYDPTERYYDGTELREETGDYERSLVTHMNCLWACAAKSVTDADGNVTANTEPTPGGTAWILDSKHPVYTENLLANSDFSRGQEGWTKWQRYALDTGEKLELIGSDDKTWGRVSLVTAEYLGWWRPAPAIAGKDYTLSVLARGLSGTMKMAAYVWFTDADGNDITGTRLNTELDLTGTATRYSIPFTTPAGTEWIRLMLGAADTRSQAVELEYTEVKLEEGRNAATAWTPNAEDLRGTDGKDGAEYMLQVTPATVYVRSDGTAEPSAIAEVTATVNGAAATPLMWADMTAVAYTGYEYLVWGTKLGTGAEEPTSPQLPASTLASKYSSLVFRLYHCVNGTRGPVLAERVVAFNKEGARGQTGAYVPPPRPYSDYPDGYVFLDGKTDVTVGGVTHSGQTRLDVILVWDAAGNKYVPWTCVKSHILDRNLTPSSPAWDTYWVSDGGTWTQIATQVLLAQNAYIKLLASRGIRIYDAAGNIVGELGSAADASPGQGVNIPLPFWLGGVLREDGAFDTNPVYGVGADGTLFIGGIDSGKRIRISGVEKKMEVYNETGRRVVTIDGNPHTVSETVEGMTETFYTQSQINGSSGNAEITASGNTTNTVAVTLGTVKTPAGGAGKYTLAMDAVLTAQTRTYISGYLQSPVVGGTAIAKYSQITSTAKVMLGIYKNGTLIASAEAQVTGETDASRRLVGVQDFPKRERLGLTFDMDGGATYIIKATYTLTPAKVTYTTTLGGPQQTAEVAASAEKRPVTYHVWTPPTNREESLLGSNGLVVKNSGAEFMRAGIVDGLGFVTEAQSRGNGFRVTPDGLQTKTGGNGWQSASVTLCAGKLDMRIPNWRPDGVDSCVSVNGNAPVLAVTSEGEVEIKGISELAGGAGGTFEARNLSVQATIAEPYQEAQPATLMARYDENTGSVLLTCLDRNGNIMRHTTVWVEIKLYPHARRGQLKQ